ncbi:MAG: SBBP repeat-containing protein [Thermoplasmata archaeon]|nr:SBBP repeat-containing protein [Thermoplasmata archaeon]
MAGGVNVYLRNLAFGCIIILFLAFVPFPIVEETTITPGVHETSIDFPTGYFVENRGQLPNEDIHYYLDSDGIQIGFAERAILVKISEQPYVDSDPLLREEQGWHIADSTSFTPVKGVLIRIVFEGSNPVRPTGRHELSHRTHYFLGSDPARWRINVRSYGEIIYQDLYDGIDLVYHVEEGLKYDFIIHPGADPAKIAVSYEGIESLRADAKGNLAVQTAVADFLDSAHYTYQGLGEEVQCVLAPLNSLTCGFECDAWDGSAPLGIDPLFYGTYLGGGGPDDGSSIAVDTSGNILVTGRTGSLNFPTTPGVFDESYNGISDVYVAKLTADGSALDYSTFIGGNNIDIGHSIAVDSDGNAYVFGRTMSTDFPTTPGAFDTTYDAGYDAFVVKLDATGSDLIYSTFLGGFQNEFGYAIAVDSTRAAYVTGFTYSTDFPTTVDAFDTSYNGGGADAFVSKLDENGSILLYSTFVGGEDGETGRSIAVDSSGNAHIAGHTYSVDFPTTPGAFDTSHNGRSDPFITKLNATGSSLIFSTFLGGSNNDYVLSIGIDSSGHSYFTGDTWSADFPTTPDSFDGTLGGKYDAFVTKLGVAGSTLVYSTFLGGSGRDYGLSIAVDLTENVWITGGTSSTNFPTTPRAFDTSYNGGLLDAFVTGLDATGSSVAYSTFVGGGFNDVELGGGQEEGRSIAVDSNGNVYVTGYTRSIDFPTTLDAFDTSYNVGSSDAFVVKLYIIRDGEGSCPLSKGFWKTHPDAWPVDSLDMGGEMYNKTELLNILWTPPRGDASVILAQQLIATELNVANGSNLPPIIAEIDEANRLLVAFSGKLPFGVKPSSLEGGNMTLVADALDAYNNGKLTPSCAG